ncbi:hypothetical protein ANO11243_095030 [Dothideomycetidae sp. 11243]|nr:hypothetical protein ANO11243_095030 [fungal sp. No.11243]
MCAAEVARDCCCASACTLAPDSAQSCGKCGPELDQLLARNGIRVNLSDGGSARGSVERSARVRGSLTQVAGGRAAAIGVGVAGCFDARTGAVPSRAWCAGRRTAGTAGRAVKGEGSERKAEMVKLREPERAQSVQQRWEKHRRRDWRGSVL